MGEVECNALDFAEVLLPFLSAAPNLKEFNINIIDPSLSRENHSLFSPDFVERVFSAANRETAIKSLYSKNKKILIWGKP